MKTSERHAKSLSDEISDASIPKLSVIFLSLFCVYQINNTLNWPNLVVIFWCLLLVYYAFFLFRPSVFNLFIIAIHAMMFVFYFIGVAADSGGKYRADYADNILTSLTLSLVLFSIISNKSAVGTDGISFERIVRFAPFVVLMWVYYTSSYIADFDIADRRDVVGRSYLTTSDLLSLFLISLSGWKRVGKIEHVTLIICGIVAISFIGSRASLILFVICMMLSFYLKFGILRLSVLLALIYLCAAYFGLGALEENRIVFSRMLSLGSILDDESALARVEQFDYFLNTLGNSFYCFLLPCQPIEHGYAHNILSSIQYFGAAGLLIVFLFAFFLTFTILKMSKEHRLIPMMIFVGLSLLLFRAWVSIVFPIFIAFAVYGMNISFTGFRPRS